MSLSVVTALHIRYLRLCPSRPHRKQSCLTMLYPRLWYKAVAGVSCNLRRPSRVQAQAPTNMASCTNHALTWFVTSKSAEGYTMIGQTVARGMSRPRHAPVVQVYLLIGCQASQVLRGRQHVPAVPQPAMLGRRAHVAQVCAVLHGTEVL